MASMEAGHGNQHPNTPGADALQRALRIKGELDQLTQREDSLQRRVAELKLNIHRAMKPLPDNERESKNAIDDVETWVQELRRLEEHKNDFASFKERRIELRFHLCRQLESLQSHFTSQGLVIKCSIADGAAGSKTGPTQVAASSGIHGSSPTTATAGTGVGSSSQGSRIERSSSARGSRQSGPQVNDTDPFNRACTRRAINFEDLYRDGVPHRYRIIREAYTHPSDPNIAGEFWILACAEHSIHCWGSTRKGTLKGAERHLSMHAGHSDENSASKSRTFECFGVAVKNCTEGLMLEYNAWVQAAVDEGRYKKETNMKSQTGRFKSGGGNGSSSATGEAATGNHIPLGPFVANPEPGELYLVHWNMNKTGAKKKPFAGLMLSMGDFSDFGLPGSFDDTWLAQMVPPCYKHRQRGQGHPGWSKGYEDDGRKLRTRKFPFLCFDHETDLQSCSKTWILAGDIHVFRADGFDAKYRRLVEQCRGLERSMVHTGQGLSRGNDPELLHHPREENYLSPSVEDAPESEVKHVDHVVRPQTEDSASTASSSSQSQTPTPLRGTPRGEVTPKEEESDLISKVAAEIVAESSFSQPPEACHMTDRGSEDSLDLQRAAKRRRMTPETPIVKAEPPTPFLRTPEVPRHTSDHDDDTGPEMGKVSTPQPSSSGPGIPGDHGSDHVGQNLSPLPLPTPKSPDQPFSSTRSKTSTPTRPGTTTPSSGDGRRSAASRGSQGSSAGKRLRSGRHVSEREALRRKRAQGTGRPEETDTIVVLD